MKEFEEFMQFVNGRMKDHNHQGLGDFEGYSSDEMHIILYDTFGDHSPIQFLDMAESDYDKIPILNQVKYLLSLVEKQGELKLTAKGYLLTKVVSDIYSQGFIKEDYIESGLVNLRRETDSMSINLTKILIQISGIVKKRHNKLSLTNLGKSVIHDNRKLLMLIFTTFTDKFNWAYYDNFGENNIGRLGYGFTLILLSKYGSEKRLDTFYAEKYLKAFPRMLNEIRESSYSTVQETASKCYTLRSFHRFLDYFGIIEIHQSDMTLRDGFVNKTSLFDKWIKITPYQ